MTAGAAWAAVLGTAAGCYVLKLAGLSVPESVLARPSVRRATDLLPVGLLAALIAVQTIGDGRSLQLDARTAGLIAAAVALALRAPFLVVVLTAAGVAAGIRAVAG
ncbi:MAG: AzlD domain-containing protein [Actinomycetota bacterium]|nr:AzlD domain-containing protein [Actinomycetota bacterium]